MGSEKRRHKRLPIRGFMKCSVDFNVKQHHLDEIDVLSLSAGGMFIAIDERQDYFMETGDALKEIHIHLEELDGLELTGRIAHRMSLGEIGGCGVEFNEVQATETTMIESFVIRKLKEFGLAAF